MKKTSTTLKNRLKQYSVLAGALAAGSAVNAQKFHVDVDPDFTHNTDGGLFALDVNNDGTVDFNINLNTNTGTNTWTSCWTSGPSSTMICTTYSYFWQTNTVSISPVNTGNGVVAATSINNFPVNLATSNLIENTMASLQWNDLSNQKLGYFYSYAGWASNSSGNFVGQTDAYVGLRVKIGADTIYGWVRIDVAGNCSSFTVKDFGWNSTPEGSILAGEVGTTVPITGSNINLFESGVSANVDGGTLVINATGLTSGADDEFALVNTTGEVIKRGKLTGETTSVGLGGVSAGIYLLRVRIGEGFGTRKILVK